MSRTQVRVGLAAVVAAALGIVLLADRSNAGGGAATKDTVLKIAAALQKGDKAEAAKLAAGLAKKIEEIDEIMNLYKLRTKKGIGAGSKPGVATPDGIELKFNNIEEKGITAGVLKKEAEALIEAAHASAAIAEVALAKGWQDEKGKKTKKAWANFSTETREASLALAGAIKDGNTDKVKAAATKLNGTCTACHNVFKP